MVHCRQPWKVTRGQNTAPNPSAPPAAQPVPALSAYAYKQAVPLVLALLRRGEGSLADVAAATGFADQSHFTAAFRRETGTTPGHFRAASA